MRWLVYAAISAVILGSSLLAREARPIAATAYTMEASILEGDPNGSIKKGTLKDLASPKARVMGGVDADILIGGSIGVQQVDFGTALKVKVVPSADGKVQITGVLEISSVKSLSDSVVLRHATAVHFAEAVVLGERVRFPMSVSENGKRWFELRVTKHDPE